MENKPVSVKLEGEYLVCTVDPNKNGVALVELKLHLSEIPSEVVDALKKKD